MTRKADTLRPFLHCAAVVLCSLALPLAVFALWDRALLAAPHTHTDGERFSAAGRANATACTLYAAEHVTKVPLGSNSLWDGGWTAGTMDGSALARARRTLRTLHEPGCCAMTAMPPRSRSAAWTTAAGSCTPRPAGWRSWCAARKKSTQTPIPSMCISS